MNWSIIWKTSTRNWSCSINQWYSIVCSFDRSIDTWASKEQKDEKVENRNVWRLVISEYCCFLHSVLFSCRLCLKIAVSGRTMTQASEKTSDFAEKVKRYTFRNCWSSLAKSIDRIIWEYHQNLRSPSYFKKIRSHEVVVANCRHRIECNEYLSLRVVVIASNVWARNCMIQLSHEYQE